MEAFIANPVGWLWTTIFLGLQNATFIFQFSAKNPSNWYFFHAFCSAKRLHQQSLNWGSFYGHNPNNALVFSKNKKIMQHYTCASGLIVWSPPQKNGNLMIWHISYPQSSKIFQMPCEDQCLDSLKPLCKGLCGFKHLCTHEVFGRLRYVCPIKMTSMYMGVS